MAENPPTLDTSLRQDQDNNSTLFDAWFPSQAGPTTLPSAVAKPTMPTYVGRGIIAPPPNAPTELMVNDPRPDLSADSLPWKRLLATAFTRDGDTANGVYGVLHGARCCGALLERRPDRWYVTRGAMDDGDWGASLRGLTSHKVAVITLLTSYVSGGTLV